MFTIQIFVLIECTARLNHLSERAGAEVVECACVIELPDLKVCIASFSYFSLYFLFIFMFGVSFRHRTYRATNLCISVALCFAFFCPLPACLSHKHSVANRLSYLNGRCVA